jgi:23S rRNA (guanosine2251-2'-O)-methyltransferase
MKKLSMEDLNRLSVEAFRESNKFSYVVVLDNVRSMANIGSVFRTADAFKAEAVILCGITATPPHREITKTALGAEESVQWIHFEDNTEAITQLKDQGFVVCAIEQADESISLKDFVPESNQKYAFVLGNEVDGVSEEVIEQCDYCIEIPQFGTKHSLNVSVTAGIICWDFVAKSI